MSFWEFVVAYRDVIAAEAQAHALLVAQAMVMASVIAIVIGAVTYRNERAADFALSTASVILTIPSLALLGLLIPLVGLGLVNVFIALVLYAQLPIVRNTLVGLRGVDPSVTDAARGLGMGRLRMLATVEIPLAWPVVLAGVRVSTQLLLGIAAIAAYVNGPGLGNLVFTGLGRLGSVNSFNYVLSGVLGVVVLALLFDGALSLLSKFTRPRGTRVLSTVK